MIKVGIEVQRLFRKNKHGMEIVALELLRELQRMCPIEGFEFIVFTKDDSDNQCLKSTEQVRIVLVPGHSYFDWEQFSLPKAVAREGIDILHCTCNTAPLKLNIPLLLTLHDVIYMEQASFNGNFYQFFGNLYRRWIVPKIAIRSDGIITVSEFEKNNIADTLKIDQHKIEVIYNAVKDECRLISDHNILSDFKDKYNLPDQFLFFIGNTASRKNVNGVLEAYTQYCSKHSDPISLVIINYDSALLPNELKHEKKIITFDYITEHDLTLMYNLATIFLYPSFREGFGMPILEAMACGTPVITSNTSSMPEVAGGAALLIDPFKPEEIAESISLLLSDTTLYNQKVEAGLQNASKFSWKRAVLRLIENYRKLA